MRSPRGQRGALAAAARGAGAKHHGGGGTPTGGVGLNLYPPSSTAPRFPLGPCGLPLYRSLLMSYEIKTGVVMPKRRRVVVSENLELLKRMGVGDMFEWVGKNPTGWYASARKVGVKVSIRVVGDGLVEGERVWGVWRVADAE